VIYYNEWEAYPAQWLRNLIKAGHLPEGEVDERDIRDVQPEDLRGFEQCHFFAGIGGWPLALQWAGWEGPVWTGSCPCQPLSSAGQRKGHADERHLWPAFYELIAQCKPPTVFGEQVASKDGREWLAGVRADLGGMDYACGAADLPAACVGSPQVRQRLWWVADARGKDVSGSEQSWGGICKQPGASPAKHGDRGISTRFPKSFHPESLVCDYGFSFRPVGIVRAYGNAIVPQVAAEFVKAYMECRP